MSRVFTNPDEALARVEDDVRRARVRAERFAELRAGIDVVRGRATSPRQDISVTVDASGVLIGLRVMDAALDRGGERLAADIRSLLVAAGQDARRAAAAATADVLGDDDPVAAQLRRRLGGSPADGRDDGGAS